MDNETKPKVKGVADILFLLDATGSMQSNIDAVKDNIGAFLDSLAAPVGFNAVTEARIRLSVFAPAMECYDDLSQIDKCEYTPVAVEPGETPVAALARFTGDREHFRKTLEMLAKSVSASAAADALEV